MCALPFPSASTSAVYESGMIVTTVYPVRSVNWEAISLAALICSCEFAEGDKARIKGFSARPSSAVGRGGGEVSVGVTSGVGVSVIGMRVARGKVQPARMNAVMSKKFIKKNNVRFTCGVLRL